MNEQMINEYKSKYDKMSLSEWSLYHQRNIHFKYQYHGIDMQKHPCDMMVYMELIGKVKPDIIIEIGAAGGGTALWLAHQLDVLGKGKLLSIDINHGGFKAEHKRIIKITGDSTKIETANNVIKHIKPENKVLLIHDGSHKKEDIKKDFNLYSQFVTVGSYFIIEDGSMDVFNWKDHRTSGHDCGLIAGIEINNENPGWVIDKECEKYIITNNPCGYLRRIK
jgi:cephalosporin hydroxylase